MKKYMRLIIVVYALMITAGCKQPCVMPPDANNLKLLVVEGHLNPGPSGTIVRLSRTVNLNDPALIKPETKAAVTVESEAGGSIYILTGNTKGEYSIASLPLNASQKYRLHIKTIDGKEYYSDYVTVKNSPPVDSLNWKKNSNGVQVFVNTHDPLNKTQYYRWEYDETWEFHSPYSSDYEYVGTQVVPRVNPLSVFICWKSEASSTILTGSSAKLLQDIITLAPVTTVPQNSIKLSVRYSINVRQYALTPEAYEYWDVMRKNTEHLGTLFDPQPSQTRSNIHCVNNPDEKIVGYISAGSVSEKRLFITKNEALPWAYKHNCLEEYPVPFNQFVNFFAPRIYLPTQPYFSATGTLLGYYGAEPVCVDCTLTGTNVKPVFW